MSTAVQGPRVGTRSLAEIVERLGDIPLDRIRLIDPLGACSEERYVEIVHGKEGLYELVDGILVEKPVGFREGRLAFVLIGFFAEYLRVNDIAFGLAPDGMTRIEGQVRMPDVSIYLWERFPGRVLPEGAILPAGPDLAVEILSPANTAAEMERKRRECFAGGTSLVWEVEPELRLVRVYPDATTFTVVNEAGTLQGEPVLPGFRLPVRNLFA